MPAEPIYEIRLAYTNAWFLRINSADWLSSEQWPELARMFSDVLVAIDRVDATSTQQKTTKGATK